MLLFISIQRFGSPQAVAGGHRSLGALRKSSLELGCKPTGPSHYSQGMIVTYGVISHRKFTDIADNATTVQAQATQHLPPLDRDAVEIPCQDTCGNEHILKYHSWINGQSRMFLLEGLQSIQVQLQQP